jgi:UDP-N-acetylglucosamine 2-epimerase (non-hydrolysing)
MTSAKKRIMVIYGTRPEAVKVAPLVKALEASDVLEPIIVNTGQHREMLDQVNEWFGIKPHLDLKVFKHGSSLNELATRIITKLDPVLESEQPDAVVVQGDTTTVAIAAITCFYRLIPVVHLEAGLRSGNIHSPFPEEANRKLAGQVSALDLAPTDAAKDNLRREGVDKRKIVVAGNTVIDALRWTADKPVVFTDDRLRREHEAGRPMILLTTHRRENWGEPMRRIGLAIAEIARRYPEHLVVFPAHANPLVRQQVVPATVGLDNVLVCEPLEYQEFVHAQKWAQLVLTDSGGVQEEAPSLGKPVLVLRENTERPEAVDAGTVRLIGTDAGRIVEEVSRLLDDPVEYEKMSRSVNPYGDGRAAERSVAAIAALLGVGTRLADFRAPAHADA